MAPGVSQLSTLVRNAAAMDDPKGNSRSSVTQAADGQSHRRSAPQVVTRSRSASSESHPGLESAVRWAARWR